MSPGLASGLVGGLLATVVATGVFFTAGRDRPLPAARLVREHVSIDGHSADAFWPGLALHVLYGTVLGGLFALIVSAASGTSDPSLLDGVGWGLGYGLVLFAVDVGGWLHAVLDVRPDRESIAEFLVLHVIYGTVLGAWVGFGLLVTV